MGFREPTQLLCPRPFTHRFPNPPAEGPDFTFARLAFDVGPRNPLAQALPCLIALPLARVHGLHSTLELLFAETDRVRCGQRLLVDRLLDVAVIQLLRWLLDHPQEAGVRPRSEEHTSELQSPMRISDAVFCLKKKKHTSYN